MTGMFSFLIIHFTAKKASSCYARLTKAFRHPSRGVVDQERLRLNVLLVVLELPQSF